MARTVNYTDFIEIIGFEGPKDPKGCFDWYSDLKVCPDGFFLETEPYGMNLSAEEIRALPRHPTGDYSQPVLKFPCSVQALISLLEEYGLRDCLNEDRLELWIAECATPDPIFTLEELAAQSDAALGAAQRAQMTGMALGNRARAAARQKEWYRWQAEADKIQAAHTRKCSKRELAELVKKTLGLPDSVDTIRKRL
jgi:hypothetical protein